MVDQDLTAAAVRERLGLDEEALELLEELQASGAPPEPVRLPSAEESAALLARLGAPNELIPEAIAAMPVPERYPELWWLLERCHHRLVQSLGTLGPWRSWPTLPPETGAPGRYFPVWVFLATLDVVRRFHVARGIPEDISWATLADLGLNMGIHLRTYGEGGLGTRNWITLHWRGILYRLGRLQFNLSRINYDPAVLEELDVPFRHGDPSLGVHIPEIGPLVPEACQASFRAARDFFDRYFPEEGRRVATCGSWLLDDQLADYLPESSNIVQFQRFFRVVPGGQVCDRSIVWFVFRRYTTELDELPQRTALQRAVVQHLQSGRHWLSRSGWIEL